MVKHEALCMPACVATCAPPRFVCAPSMHFCDALICSIEHMPDCTTCFVHNVCVTAMEADAPRHMELFPEEYGTAVLQGSGAYTPYPLPPSTNNQQGQQLSQQAVQSGMAAAAALGVLPKPPPPGYVRQHRTMEAVPPSAAQLTALVAGGWGSAPEPFHGYANTALTSDMMVGCW